MTQYDLSAKLTEGMTAVFDGESTSDRPTLHNTLGEKYQESANSTVTASSTVLYTRWLPKGYWTKTLVSAPREVCRPPRSFNVSVTGTYSLNISATGDIALVKGTAGMTGSMSLTAGITYTWTACAYFQRTDIERYQRYELWAYYSDGSTKWTGGVSNIRQPAQYGDVTDRRISSWNVR